MNASFSYYEILGVVPTASQAEIKAAYHAAVRKYHPDVNSAPNAQRLTEILNEAYAVLSDPEKRRSYDSGTDSDAPAEEEAVWPLFACDRCGTVTPHLRYCAFYYVFSIVFYSQGTPKGGIFCDACRSNLAVTSSLFSMCLGWWGFPWGVIYTFRAIIGAIRGGVQPRAPNAQLLRHQAIAYSQRAMMDEARAALESARHFEKDEAIDSLLRDPMFSTVTPCPHKHWLSGQTVAVGALLVPILLFGAFIFNAVSVGESEAPPSPNTTADTRAATSPPPVTQVKALMSSCENAGQGDAKTALASCDQLLAALTAASSAFTSQEDKDGYRYMVDMSHVYKAGALFRLGHKSEALATAQPAMADLRSLSTSASSSKIRGWAQSQVDCLENNNCGGDSK